MELLVKSLLKIAVPKDVVPCLLCLVRLKTEAITVICEDRLWKQQIWNSLAVTLFFVCVCVFKYLESSNSFQPGLNSQLLIAWTLFYFLFAFWMFSAISLKLQKAQHQRADHQRNIEPIMSQKVWMSVKPFSNPATS